METSPTKTEKTSPKTLKSFGQNPKRITEKKSHRKSSADPLAISLIYSSKERPPRRSTNSRFIKPERVYQVSEIQNAHHPRDQTSAPTRILDCVHRSLGWLLAHSHCTEQKTLSGFQIQRNTLPVSVPSFWLKRRSTSLYQNHSTRRESPSRGRYLVSTIPRRPSTHCQNERRMRNHHSEGTEDNQKHGTTRQRKEVKTHSEPRFRMAWSTMESPVTYSTGSRDKVPTPPGGSEVHHNLRILYEKNSNEGTRSLQLDRPERPQHTIDHVNYKNNLEDFPKTSPRHTDPNTKEPELGWYGYFCDSSSTLTSKVT